MESRLFLDVIVREGTAVLKLFAGEDQALLVGRDPFLVWSGVSRSGRGAHEVDGLALDLGLDIVDGVGRFDLEGDGLTREGLNEYLHDGLDL